MVNLLLTLRFHNLLIIFVNLNPNYLFIDVKITIVKSQHTYTIWLFCTETSVLNFGI